MGPPETIDTGQKQVKQKKFVSTKRKIAAKKLSKIGAKKHLKAKPSAEPSASVPLFDNDPLSTNSTIGSANRLPTGSKIPGLEVRRPGWNRQTVGVTVSPFGADVFGADQPSPPPSRNIQMLKIGLGVLGGIALLLGSLASFRDRQLTSAK